MSPRRGSPCALTMATPWKASSTWSPLASTPVRGGACRKTSKPHNCTRKLDYIRFTRTFYRAGSDHDRLDHASLRRSLKPYTYEDCRWDCKRRRTRETSSLMRPHLRGPPCSPSLLVVRMIRSDTSPNCLPQRRTQTWTISPPQVYTTPVKISCAPCRLDP